MRKPLAVALLAAVVALAGCGKKEEPAPAPAPTSIPQPTAVPTPAAPAVAGVTLGTSVGADKKVAAPSESFSPKDKIYASVETSGQGHLKLRALWSFVKGEKTTKVNETTMEVDTTGPAWNEFHIENKKDWPKGDYKVEIFLNDATTASATKTFTVK